MQCQGRLVKNDKLGDGMLTFDGGPRFHLPFRCDRATNTDLCDKCVARREKTAGVLRAHLEEKKPITNHPTLLHGKVTEAIPWWSHLVGGSWYQDQLNKGCRLTSEAMARIKATVEKAQEGVGAAAAEPAPAPRRRGPKPKAVAAAAEPPAEAPARVQTTIAFPVVSAEEAAATSVAVHEAMPAATPTPTIKKTRKKTVTTTVAPPKYVVKDPADIVYTKEILQVEVKKVSVGDRSLYLDPIKDKLYDLKFKYLGRLKDGAVVDFPDSDVEA